MPGAKGARSMRNTEKLKKKTASTLDRAPKSRNTGVTSRGRTTAKKAAGIARARKAAV
jgi:hypothetical protein